MAVPSPILGGFLSDKVWFLVAKLLYNLLCMSVSSDVEELLFSRLSYKKDGWHICKDSFYKWEYNLLVPLVYKSCYKNINIDYHFQDMITSAF